jgi:uncharacterized protein (TIGR00730 family)
MEHDVKFATLFGGAMNNTTSPEYLETVRIGQLLADLGYVVKSGGYRGMMEAVSKGATEQGGKAIGYTCRTFPSALGNEFLSETIVCDTLFDRLHRLISGSEVFVVQRGGIGTLSELFLCLDILRKVKLDKRPEVFLIGDYWKDALSGIEQAFFGQRERSLYKVVSGADDLKRHLEAAKATVGVQK